MRRTSPLKNQVVGWAFQGYPCLFGVERCLVSVSYVHDETRRRLTGVPDVLLNLTLVIRYTVCV